METSYKEKYEDILARLERAKNDDEVCDERFCCVIDDLIPELAEPEDEKIKHEIKVVLANTDFSESALEYTFADMIAWLEKQGQVKESAISQHENRTCEENGNSLTYDDEKVRNALIDFFSNGAKYGGHTNGIYDKDILAWLEKQGEKDILEDAILDGNEDGLIAETIRYKHEKQSKQKSDKVEPKFKVGDFIANDYCFGKVVALTDDAYLLDTEQGVPFSCEHNVHLWTIDDAKDGDVLYINNTVSESIIIYKSFNNRLIKKYASYNKFGFEGEHYLTLNDGYIVPATKEQCDLLFRKMKEAGYEWDAEKKELKKINSYCQENCKGFQETGKCFADGECKAKRESDQKPEENKGNIGGISSNSAWSEEDERMLQETIDWFEKKCFPYALESENPARESIKWLKSLRPQNRWKPSDKQMGCLSDAIEHYNSWGYPAPKLKELLDDLKKLKGKV